MRRLTFSNARWRAGLALAAAVFASACAHEAPEPRSAIERAELAYQAAPGNEKVLVATEIAGDLMQQGYVAEAQEYLLRATGIIETVFSEDRYAEQASSLWKGESRKIFRGEPYERATSYFHLGIAFLLQDDYENARNCFRSAAFQDAFAAEDQDTSDFYLMNHLEAVADARLGGGRAGVADLIERIEDHRDALVMPRAGDNLLIIYESGPPPVKVAEGQYGEYLAFRDGGDPVWAVEATLGTERYYVYDGANLFYQAVTRGGRFVDHINRRKANYKKAAKITANVAWTVGIAMFEAAALSSDSDAAATLVTIGAVALFVGGTFYVVGELITPDADLRTQSTVPNRIYVRSLRAPETADTIVLRAYGQHLNEVGQPQTIELPASRDGLMVVYTTPRGTVTNWTMRRER